MLNLMMKDARRKTAEEKERLTLLMLWLKFSVEEVVFTLPILFMTLLDTSNSAGKEIPSPKAPKKPIVISNLSSACMKIDQNDPFFSVIIVDSVVPLLLLPFFLLWSVVVLLMWKQNHKHLVILAIFNSLTHNSFNFLFNNNKKLF